MRTCLNCSYIIKLFFLSGMLLSAFFSHAIEGTVVDNFGKPIDRARLRFTNVYDTTKQYYVWTDTAGHYEIDLPELHFTTYENEEFVLFRHYPNPFNNQVVIPFAVIERGAVNVNIYDLTGRLVTNLTKQEYDPGIYYLMWNGRDESNHKVKQGMYLYSVIYEDQKFTGKIVRINQAPDIASGQHLNIPDFYLDTVFIKYDILVQKDGFESRKALQVSEHEVDTLNFVLFYDTDLPYACVGNYIGVWDGHDYKKVFVKGINLGVALPGTQPGAMAATRDEYRRWIKRIGELGFNSIRAYTLHFPRFYEELYAYNTAHPQDPIYLFQGVWLNEELSTNNFYDLSNEFDADIEEVIDCVHGNRQIDERAGKAYGIYTSNVSRWIMGYIIGREIHPYEVIPTDSINSTVTGYAGMSVRIDSATPTEAWITARLDHLVTYEKETYKVGRPFSFSSWPTMDPITHPTEQVNFTDEDVTQFDLENINTFGAPGGYFASFHAYPYYPDFVSDDPEYQKYVDIGPNSYVGYLTDLKKHYSNRPLIIAEFGTPSSWGNAHYAHSGMNHGGNSEEQQGINDARLMSNIYHTDCGGGMLFSWIDEWFKVTWITEPIGTVAERRHFWQNLTSPEQNFGLITFDPPKPEYKPLQFFNTNCELDSLGYATDFQYLRLKLKLKSPFLKDDTLWVSFDTYKSNVGEKYLPDGTEVSSRSEFALKVTDSDTAELYVTEAYDLFEIWFTDWADPKQLFHTTTTNGAPWNIIRWRNDEDEDAIQYIGKLRVWWPGKDSTNLDAVYVDSNVVEIRIPWTLLNFVDPSLLEVMNDDRTTYDERETGFTDGITVAVVFRNCVNQALKFTWLPWDAADGIEYYEREKKSMQIFSNALKRFPDFIK